MSTTSRTVDQIVVGSHIEVSSFPLQRSSSVVTTGPFRANFTRSSCRRYSEADEPLHRTRSVSVGLNKHAAYHSSKHPRAKSDGDCGIEASFKFASVALAHPMEHNLTSTMQGRPRRQFLHGKHENVHAPMRRLDLPLKPATGEQPHLTSSHGYDGTSDRNLIRPSSIDGHCPVDGPIAPSIASPDRSHARSDQDTRLSQPLPEDLGSDAEAPLNEANHESRIAFKNPFSDDVEASRKFSGTSGSSTTYHIRPNAFPGHRDTFARILHSQILQAYDDDATPTSLSYTTLQARRPSTPSTISPAIIQPILKHLSFSDYKLMRLVCRQWSRDLPDPCFSALYRLPGELVQEIMSYLSPCDFDASRHTCASWYLAGQDRRLQKHMLKLSGCSSAFEEDLRLHFSIEGEKACSSGFLGIRTRRKSVDLSCLDQEWICGKRLATESRLSPSWRGHSTEYSPRVFLREMIDFSRLLNSTTDETNRAKSTVSACGRFVLVNSGCDISIYNLHDREGTLKPVVRLAAGTEVLKVSMDTSSERYAVAALLADRKGMLWELLGDMTQAHYRSDSGEPISLGMQAHVQSSASSPVSSDIALNLSMRSADYHGVVAFHQILGHSNFRSDSPSPRPVRDSPLC